MRYRLPVSRVGLLVTYELDGIVSFLLQKINAVERMGEDKQKETISRSLLKQPKHDAIRAPTCFWREKARV